jgi:hypothetical protein
MWSAQQTGHRARLILGTPEGGTAMRRYIKATLMAIGLVALWAALVPLVA